MREGGPADLAGVRSILTGFAFPRPPDFPGDVTHDVVVCFGDCMTNRRGFGGAGGELGGQTYGFMRREGEVVGAEFPFSAGPFLSVVGALAFIQFFEIIVLGREVGIDAERPGDGEGHVLAPLCPGITSGVIGRKATALVGIGRIVGRVRLTLRIVIYDVLAPSVRGYCLEGDQRGLPLATMGSSLAS